MKVFSHKEALLLAKVIHEQRRRNREDIELHSKNKDVTSVEYLEKENLDLHVILRVIWEATTINEDF